MGPRRHLSTKVSSEKVQFLAKIFAAMLSRVSPNVRSLHMLAPFRTFDAAATPRHEDGTINQGLMQSWYFVCDGASAEVKEAAAAEEAVIGS